MSAVPSVPPQNISNHPASQGVILNRTVPRMNYVNFEDAFTRKHGIVVEGWPLREFRNPSEIKTIHEVKTLYNAWKSGAARFRKLTQEDWDKWMENDFQKKLREQEEDENAWVDMDEEDGETEGGRPARSDTQGSTALPQQADTGSTLDNNTSESVITTSSGIADSELSNKRPADGPVPGASQPKKKTKTTAAPLGDIINTVGGSSGTVNLPAKKERKKRSDAGIKRGPRKKKDNAENRPVEQE